MFSPKEQTLLNVLKQSAGRFSAKAALSTIDGPPITYASLLEQAQSISSFLHQRGIITGDRVAILSENSPNWGIAYFAITSMGAVVVPILPDFHSNEVQHIVRHAECKAIFVSTRLYAKIEDVQFEDLTTTILVDDFTLVPPKTRKDTLSSLMEQGGREFAKLKEAALKFTRRIPETVTPETLAAIVYTSGTTGHSKGVMLTHRNIVADAEATTRIVPIVPEDRLLSILPLSHTYECTLGLVLPIMCGAALYYLDKLPSAAVLLPAMAKVKPTIMLSVPLVMEKMFKSKIQPQLRRSAVLRGLMKIPFVRKRIHRKAGRKLMETFGGELKAFCIGGASLAPDVEFFLREARFPYAIGYGLTETSPLVAGSGPTRTRFRAIGPAIPGTQIRIINPDPVTGEGEIAIKGPTVMKGYYKDPARTAEVFTPDGWFKTGDLGVLDSDNYLFIKGRLKNMILGPSGKNIYPEEIESTINEFEVVLESLVFEQQNQLIARIHLNYDELDRTLSSESLDESQTRRKIKELLGELQSQINARLSSFSRIHRIIEQREPFEKTPTQKIKRHLYLA